MAASYNNIGMVYDSQGKYEEALEYYQKDLEITIKVVGHDHPDVATSFQNIAALYYNQGNQVQAKEMATKAYSILLKVLGPDHPQTEVVKSFYHL